MAERPNQKFSTTAVLHNYVQEMLHLNQGDRIAQLILIHIKTPPFTRMIKSIDTQQADRVFGSTGELVKVMLHP
jgi:dUTPase